MEPGPRDVMESFARAWSARDAAAVAALFADDADFVNVVGLWWRSRKAIERAHAYGFKRIFAAARLHFERIEVKPVAAGVATVHGQWVLHGQSRQGSDEAGERRGVLLLVVRREGAGWIAVAAHNTDIVPGADTILARGTARV